MVEEKQQIGKWEVVELDIEGLCGALAHTAWVAEASRKGKEQHLYDEKGEVTEEWSQVYWSLFRSIKALTESYIKPIADDTEQKKSDNRADQGIDPATCDRV